jgi:predicted dehydrogenase
MKRNLNRRDFIKAGGIITAGSFFRDGTRTHVLAWAGTGPERTYSANEQIQLALIGAGGQGMHDTRTALEVPGVRLVAVADCYDGRLAHCKEMWGNDILTTRDYREILARRDVDAVIIGTPDHWHKQAAVEAMNAGKDVYLEKPMIHSHDEGPAIIEAARRTKRIVEVGSQRVSSILYQKAREIVQSGALGQITAVSAWWDRNSSIGAWNYTVPPDASTSTIDWDRFLGSAPKIPFNPEHFFQWRKWKAYGTGVAGDLFVHLFSGTHFVTGSNGPTRALATGGLRFWKDGRDALDVLFGLFDYPQNWNLILRVNFCCGGPESEGFVFTGSEGSLEIGDGITLTRVPRETEPGYTIDTFAQPMQEKFLAEYRRKYPRAHPTGPAPKGEEKFVAPPDYSDSYDHLKNFIEAVRTRQPVTEDATFGYRAAGAALLANLSIERGAIMRWDPEAMKLL